MPDKPHITERAYQIAKTGGIRSIEDLIQKLKAEGYDNYRAYITGSLRRELGKVIKG